MQLSVRCEEAGNTTTCSRHWKMARLVNANVTSLGEERTTVNFIRAGWC